jgi:hypothetical protein
VPLRRSVISPACFKTLNCCETAGRLTGKPSAMAETGRGAARMRPNTSRLVGSESAASAAS